MQETTIIAFRGFDINLRRAILLDTLGDAAGGGVRFDPRRIGLNQDKEVRK